MTLNICIIGAGAMGCLIGGKLVQAGQQVSFIARGKQLETLGKQGLILDTDGEYWHGSVTATDDPHTLGAQDVILLCTKAYQLPHTVGLLPPLMHKETVIVPAVNGIPWWYFEKHGGPYEGRSIRSLDPKGALREAIATDRIIGCVNYLGGTLVEPGRVHYVPEIKKRITLGEIDGAVTPRLQKIAAAFDAAGFAPKVTESIRDTIWHKLWGNIAFNPISALTHGTIDQIAEGYHDIDLVTAVMN